jgi:septum site-determining protein MinC
MIDTKDRERKLLLDVSKAENSAQAVSMVEEYVQRQAGSLQPNSSSDSKEGRYFSKRVNFSTGGLVLSQKVLNKMKTLLATLDMELDTIYTSIPQTQLAALGEGFFVKETPVESIPWIPELESQSASQKPLSTAEATPEWIEKSLSSLLDPLLKDEALDLKTTALKKNDLLKKQESATIESEEQADATASSVDVSDVKVVKDSPVSTESITPEKPSLIAETRTAPIKLDSTAVPTLYLKQTLRSGKVIHFDGHVVIIGDVHAGSEITASGDITVWGELKGIAQAGSEGNYRAEIRALKIEAIQLRIADFIARRPDRIYYHKDHLSDGLLGVECAKVADGEIKIIQELIGR